MAEPWLSKGEFYHLLPPWDSRVKSFITYTLTLILLNNIGNALFEVNEFIFIGN